MTLNHQVEFIDRQTLLDAAIERMERAEALAVDIETINWWDRQAEKISILQIAFRESAVLCVLVIDAMIDLDLEALRRPLEMGLNIKAIHNASFDATRLAKHLQIATSPIHDTMLAARRSGDKKCSLKAQVEAHLAIELDKTEQRSDWSRRPLHLEQLDYAARDAACTLLLYELQIARGLRGDYELSDRSPRTGQPEPAPSLPFSHPEPASVSLNLTPSGFALLGIVSHLPGRYSPEQLSVSVGSERIGMAGWIIDRLLGSEYDLDENSARQEIAQLLEQKLIQLSLSRRLEATPAGTSLWQQNKPA